MDSLCEHLLALAPLTEEEDSNNRSSALCLLLMAPQVQEKLARSFAAQSSSQMTSVWEAFKSRVCNDTSTNILAAPLMRAIAASTVFASTPPFLQAAVPFELFRHFFEHVSSFVSPKLAI